MCQANTNQYTYFIIILNNLRGKTLFLELTCNIPNYNSLYWKMKKKKKHIHLHALITV